MRTISIAGGILLTSLLLSACGSTVSERAATGGLAGAAAGGIIGGSTTGAVVGGAAGAGLGAATAPDHR